MKILLMTSGSGTTARYLTEKLIEDKGQLANGVIHCGFVYEPHEKYREQSKTPDILRQQNRKYQFL